MVANTNFDASISSVTASDSLAASTATAAFQGDFQRTELPRSTFTDNTPRSLFIRPIDAPPPPAGIDQAAWSQISEWTAGDKNVKFVTAASGQVPDYIVGNDGKMVKNPAKTTPNPDGSITVQVDNSEGLAAAKKVAQQLQVAAVQEKIFYWQRANPGSTSIPEFLKGMLHTAQTADVDVPAPPQQAQPRVEMPQIQAQQEAPVQQSAPREMPQPVSSGGYSGGGGPGGGAPERIGNSNIGSAPSSGYRDGSFDTGGPIDRSAIPAPVAGDLSIKGPPSCTVDQIQEFLTKMGSPAAKEEGFSQALYDACTNRGIDPAVAVGFFLQESTCGKYGRANGNHSLGNIKGTSPESHQSDGTFRKYNTWAEGARDWARLIDESYVQKRGLETMSQVISVYAPSSDGNNERQYVATVKGVVENFKKQNGGTAVA
ncbi:MAG: glucosaminidase domain-containing protein [Candidatus Obscuribacterales bacterium]|nr:glucosaminidase domain-containing protein [Candidatus Obscuribacterales bacterium]